MDIFVIKTSECENFSDDFLKKFQKKEIRNEEKLKIHCLTYAMLDSILREVYKIDNRELLFEKGKPILKNGVKHFSLSHSGEFIVIAVSNYNCGVDIEQIKERDYKAISKRMGFECSTKEEFYINWTKFEAEYKLRQNTKKNFNITLGDYVLSAVSINHDEDFDLFIS